MSFENVRYGRLEVRYSVHTNMRVASGGSKIGLKNYRQQDVHSCGFVAALTVARYFRPDITDREVLRAVRPSINYGVNRFNLVAGLRKIGVRPNYRKNLTLDDLKRHVEKGIPVIVSVWPCEWANDHWTVVQGFDDERVYLTNYRSLPTTAFETEWSDMDMRGYGQSKEGIVCIPR